MRKTNYWRLHDLLGYELADFLGTLADCARCPMLQECKCKSDCINHWCEWLESEAE